MTEKEVHEFAKQADLCWTNGQPMIEIHLLERFAALVAAEKDKEIAELQTSLRICKSSEERAQVYLEVAKKMRDESRPDVLKSERAANAKLTEELEKAELLVAEKDRQIAFLKDSHDAIRELAYKTGAEEEREACAKVCEEHETHGFQNYPGRNFAFYIRARGEA